MTLENQIRVNKQKLLFFFSISNICCQLYIKYFIYPTIRRGGWGWQGDDIIIHVEGKLTLPTPPVCFILRETTGNAGRGGGGWDI